MVRIVCLIAAVVFYGASGLVSSAAPRSGSGGHPRRAVLRARAAQRKAWHVVVPHVVVIVQENRSLDDLFNGFPQANTVRVDPYTGRHLTAISMGGAQGAWNPAHSHSSPKGGFTVECAAPVSSSACTMTGFASESVGGCQAGCPGAFAYVKPAEVAPYWSIATQGELLDDLFQCNSGPSFPAHQCLIAGQTGGYFDDGTIDLTLPYAWSENAHDPVCSHVGGEGSQVNVTTAFPGKGRRGRLCSTYETIFDEATFAGLTWRYYTDTTRSLWSGPENVAQDYDSASIVAPDFKFFNDLASGDLANLTYIIPKDPWSDHPGLQKISWGGTDWVGNIVNAIEASPFAATTEILITWDDWGGWYDHVVPPIWQPNSYGFRVPGIIIGPGVIPNEVDHAEHNQASFVLGTAEYLLNLPSLNQEDAQMAAFENFNFVQFPGAPSYTPVPVHSPASWYFQQRVIEAEDEGDPSD